MMTYFIAFLNSKYFLIKECSLFYVLMLCLTPRPSDSQSIALTYPQSIFDSDTCCWRELAREEQFVEAGNLIISYLHDSRPTNPHSLRWHAGQMFALGSNKAMAITYFKKTYTIFHRLSGGEDGRSWYLYAKGSVAFLQKDRKQFTHLLNIWTKHLPYDLNYDQLLLLEKHWGQPYGFALNF